MSGKPLSKRQIGHILHSETIRQILSLCGALPFCRIWPNNTGTALSQDKKRFLRYGLKGSADLMGILMGGRSLWIEVKTGNAKQNSHQVNFQQMIEDHGGLYLITGNQHNPNIDEFSMELMSEHKRHTYITNEILACAKLCAVETLNLLSEFK